MKNISREFKLEFFGSAFNLILWAIAIGTHGDDDATKPLILYLATFLLNIS